MSRLTVPEVRRLLQAAHGSPHERRFHQWWSTFRRRHQALARHCHARRREQMYDPWLTGSGVVILPGLSRELDDALWEEIAMLLPKARRRGEEPPLAYRAILEAILWIAQTGVAWRDLPERFGAWRTVHGTYYRWQQLGYWPAVLAALQAAR